jgi:hypothetical protein
VFLGNCAQKNIILRIIDHRQCDLDHEMLVI